MIERLIIKAQELIDNDNYTKALLIYYKAWKKQVYYIDCTKKDIIDFLESKIKSILNDKDKIIQEQVIRRFEATHWCKFVDKFAPIDLVYEGV